MEFGGSGTNRSFSGNLLQALAARMTSRIGKSFKRYMTGYDWVLYKNTHLRETRFLINALCCILHDLFIQSEIIRS